MAEAGPMKLLASPRMRRRFGWLAAVLALAGVVGLLVVLLPGRHVTETPRVEGGYTPPKPEKTVRHTNRDLVMALDTATRFLLTAVKREHVGASWDLIAPSYEGKAEFTRKEWAKGDRAQGGEGIPVVEYPVDRAKWKLDYSLKNEVGLKVALFPPKGDKTPATVFDIALRAYGKGKSRRWLVDYFSPAGSRTIKTATPRAPAGLPNLDPELTAPHRLSTFWLIVPIGILGLALLVPIILGIGYAIRVRRAERDFASAGRTS